MKENFGIVQLIIFLLVPLIGLGVFLWLQRKMSKTPTAPNLPMFVLFFSYGGLLMLTLTVFFEEWSGLASLGAFYLIFIAPVLMAILAYKQYKLRHLSNYHKWVLILNVSYFIIAPLTFIILYHFSKT